MKFLKQFAPDYTRIRETICRTLTVTAMLLVCFSTAFGRNPVEAVDTITAAEAFLKMPQQDLDLLTKSMRQDMLDYMVERDSIYKKTNIYMGQSWIETMKPDYMKVRLSEVSSLQIKLLKQPGYTLPIVMTVYTIDDGNGTADSTLKFFNNSMSELQTSKFITLPKPEDFYNLPKDSPVSAHDLEEELPFYTIQLTVNPESGGLTGKLTSANGLTKEQAERLKPYLRQELNWVWNGKKMLLQK